MKILIDTNVLLSSALFIDGVARKAYNKAVNEPNKAVVCDFSIEELRRVFNRKFSHMLYKLDEFIVQSMSTVEIVNTPTTPVSQEELIRDEFDKPIFRAAIKAKVDGILTGDKDFLESGITKPKMLSPSEFLAMKK